MHWCVVEFYEEILAIVDSLTVTSVSAPMWQVFDYMFTMFTQEGYDYFLDFLPPLHNFVTVDTPAFEGDPARVEKVFLICRQVRNFQQSISCATLQAGRGVYIALFIVLLGKFCVVLNVRSPEG